MNTYVGTLLGILLQHPVFRSSQGKTRLPAAFEILLGCFGEVRVTARAAGCLADQQGKYTSPGQEFVSGIRISARKLVTGWQQRKRKKICPLGGRVAQSYRPAHDMQQYDHPVYRKIPFSSFPFIYGSPQSVFHSRTKTIWQRWWPRADMGDADNHAPD